MFRIIKKLFKPRYKVDYSKARYKIGDVISSESSGDYITGSRKVIAVDVKLDTRYLLENDSGERHWSRCKNSRCKTVDTHVNAYFWYLLEYHDGSRQWDNLCYEKPQELSRE